MSGSERRKGREGEHEARGIFTRAGFTVTALQAGRTGRVDVGDFTAQYEQGSSVDTLVLENLRHISLVCDSKRREKVRVVEWSRAIEQAARDGEIPVTVWRQSHEPWRVTLLAEDFARLVAR